MSDVLANAPVAAIATASKGDLIACRGFRLPDLTLDAPLGLGEGAEATTRARDERAARRALALAQLTEGASIASTRTMSSEVGKAWESLK